MIHRRGAHHAAIVVHRHLGARLALAVQHGRLFVGHTTVGYRALDVARVVDGLWQAGLDWRSDVNQNREFVRGATDLTCRIRGGCDEAMQAFGQCRRRDAPLSLSIGDGGSQGHQFARRQLVEKLDDIAGGRRAFDIGVHFVGHQRISHHTAAQRRRWLLDQGSERGNRHEHRWGHHRFLLRTFGSRIAEQCCDAVDIRINDWRSRWTSRHLKINRNGRPSHVARPVHWPHLE